MKLIFEFLLQFNLSNTAQICFLLVRKSGATKFAKSQYNLFVLEAFKVKRTSEIGTAIAIFYDEIYHLLLLLQIQSVPPVNIINGNN